MDKDFASWLNDELSARGWTYSELARRAGVVASTVSMVASGKSSPGFDLCQGIARAFAVPLETVYRKAGLLPDMQDDAQIYEIADIARRLSPAVREEVKKYALWRYKRERGEDKGIE